MAERKVPHLTAEQTIKLQKMLALSKYVRIVFIVGVLIGAVLGLVGSFVDKQTQTILLICCGGVLAVVIICAVILFWNLHRVKNYCRSLGMDI